MMSGRIFGSKPASSNNPLMPLSVKEWHDRFTVQAGWTRALREQLFNSLNISRGSRLLEAGSGTGAVAGDLARDRPGTWYCCDIRERYSQAASRFFPTLKCLSADVHTLPFPDSAFEIVFCHYFLLWVEDPLGCLKEMRRVTRSGGTIAALAEPDYGGRLDYPENFSHLKELQIAGLKEKGADPFLGRKLSALFQQAGIQHVQAGVYQGRWKGTPTSEEISSEWKVLQEDLASQLTKEELRKLKLQEEQAWSNQHRMLFVPTFYAWGKAP